ncbi:hypothetical protein E5288_WYG003914 [Bos mutus]|uniref:Uncharacterized protein n=1 Tax=Bos mutus TaxID=72004 RepID=A0A6B0S5Y9_9CETA|nr:hypothetical protein [Bos mutus]
MTRPLLRRRHSQLRSRVEQRALRLPPNNKRAAPPTTPPQRFQNPVERNSDGLKGGTCIASCVPNFISLSNIDNKEKWTVGLIGTKP